MKEWGGRTLQILIGIIIIAIVYMLVRPGSPVAGALTDIENVLAGMIKTATGQPQGGAAGV